MSNFPYMNAVLTLPRLRIQNFNTISSPLTWGAPAMTAAIGFMHALQRKIPAEWHLDLMSVGLVVHDFQAQTYQNGYMQHTFKLTRNPVGKDGKTEGIVEEGRAHMEATLVFGVDIDESVNTEAERKEYAQQVQEMAMAMRFAGGSILPALPGHHAPSQQPELHILGDEEESKTKLFRVMRRQWLPGSTLVSRDDLLAEHLQELQQQDPTSTALDAWMDLSRLNRRSVEKEVRVPNSDEVETSVSWEYARQAGGGWLVPIPIGFGALSEVHPAGAVKNARDNFIPFRFVESLYSIGEWIGPHRLQSFEEMLWYPDTNEEAGIYRCANDYSAPNPHSDN